MQDAKSNAAVDGGKTDAAGATDPRQPWDRPQVVRIFCKDAEVGTGDGIDLDLQNS